MDPDVYLWTRAIHIYTFLVWIGSLIGLSFILKQHSKAAEGARGDFIQLEKGVAIAMDIGATVAMVAGTVLLLGIKPSLMKGASFMHIKLTLVVVVIAIHGVQRMRVGKYKRGEVTPEPAWVIPVLEVAVLAIIVMIAVRPF